MYISDVHKNIIFKEGVSNRFEKFLLAVNPMNNLQYCHNIASRFFTKEFSFYESKTSLFAKSNKLEEASFLLCNKNKRKQWIKDLETLKSEIQTVIHAFQNECKQLSGLVGMGFKAQNILKPLEGLTGRMQSQYENVDGLLNILKDVDQNPQMCNNQGIAIEFVKITDRVNQMMLSSRQPFKRFYPRAPGNTLPKIPVLVK